MEFKCILSLSARAHTHHRPHVHHRHPDLCFKAPEAHTMGGYMVVNVTGILPHFDYLPVYAFDSH